MAEHSRRYEPTSEGLRSMAALVVLRDKVIVPLLAGAGHRKKGPKPSHRDPLDIHYEAVQRQMQELFDAIGIAA